MCSVVMDAFRIEQGIETNEKRALEYPPPMRQFWPVELLEIK